MMAMRNGDTPVTAPADGTATRRYYGKYAGLVTDNSAPEGENHRGQIKVKVPGILEETPDGNDSRPIEVLAAPCFLPGFFFVPEQDVQVWVEFVAGDINYPIWTGVWYPNGGPPNDSDGNAPDEKQKIVRTPLGTSAAKGNVIHFSDTSGGQKIVIKDENNGDNGNMITLDQNGIKIEASKSNALVTLSFAQTTVVVKDESIELTKGSSKVTVSSDGITLDAGSGTITLKANSVSVQVQSSMDIQ